MSSTSNLNIHQDISVLFAKNKLTKTAEKIHSAGFQTIEDLLWIVPLRIQRSPKILSYTELEEGAVFRGSGSIVSQRETPAYGVKAKSKVQLVNITVQIKDALSNEVLTLKWFNAYPGIKKKLNSSDSFEFIGPVTKYNGSYSINNPKLIEDSSKYDNEEYLIEYPTINGVTGNFIKKIIQKIPNSLWSSLKEHLPNAVFSKKNFFTISESFKFLHGRYPVSKWSKESLSKAKTRLIYEEFLNDQIHIYTRRKLLRNRQGIPLAIAKSDMDKYLSLFPYDLTKAQDKSITEVLENLNSEIPMMRMLQGDVGCGKTTVALIAAVLVVDKGYQVAIMAPTETLAKQHFTSFNELLGDKINIGLLVGAQKQKKKNETVKLIKEGHYQIVIGTHSLFQDKVEFKSLALSIIDEQHKFGVEQRLRLIRKGNNPHCLLMTATPIPRTLRLTQYGDLDISIIDELPGNRKGIKTRIVSKSTYEKYLSFIKTRVSIGEQVYVVVPAIEESETLDLNNVKRIYEKYKQIFPNINISFLHGQMPVEEKDKAISDFKEKKFDILISTSVIEVGIDIPNSTVMSVYNPERFGLSSLHQLRGRVGRGNKMGFCFLINETGLSPDAMKRLQIMEKTTDGFKISEEDLKFRGEGNIFGAQQSGTHSVRRIANIFINHDVLQEVYKDMEYLKENNLAYIESRVQNFKNDDKITSTI
jgi:ATP-dependent DNA helicase RecG